MVDKNYTKNVEDCCNGLKAAKQYLKDAADNVENHSTRERIEQQMGNVEDCLKGCENILNTISKQ